MFRDSGSSVRVGNIESEDLLLPQIKIPWNWELLIMWHKWEPMDRLINRLRRMTISHSEIKLSSPAMGLEKSCTIRWIVRLNRCKSIPNKLIHESASDAEIKYQWWTNLIQWHLCTLCFPIEARSCISMTRGHKLCGERRRSNACEIQNYDEFHGRWLFFLIAGDGSLLFALPPQHITHFCKSLTGYSLYLLRERGNILHRVKRMMKSGSKWCFLKTLGLTVLGSETMTCSFSLDLCLFKDFTHRLSLPPFFSLCDIFGSDASVSRVEIARCTGITMK